MDGTGLPERLELGFGGAYDFPPSISIAKCGSDLRCSELLVATGSCRGSIAACASMVFTCVASHVIPCYACSWRDGGRWWRQRWMI